MWLGTEWTWLKIIWDVCICQIWKMIILSEIIIFPWLLSNLNPTRITGGECVYSVLQIKIACCVFDQQVSTLKHMPVALESKVKIKPELWTQPFFFLCLILLFLYWHKSLHQIPTLNLKSHSTLGSRLTVHTKTGLWVISHLSVLLLFESSLMQVGMSGQGKDGPGDMTLMLGLKATALSGDNKPMGLKTNCLQPKWS